MSFGTLTFNPPRPAQPFSLRQSTHGNDHPRFFLASQKGDTAVALGAFRCRPSRYRRKHLRPSGTGTPRRRPGRTKSDRGPRAPGSGAGQECPGGLHVPTPPASPRLGHPRGTAPCRSLADDRQAGRSRRGPRRDAAASRRPHAHRFLQGFAWRIPVLEIEARSARPRRYALRR